MHRAICRIDHYRGAWQSGSEPAERAKDGPLNRALRADLADSFGRHRLWLRRHDGRARPYRGCHRRCQPTRPQGPDRGLCAGRYQDLPVRRHPRADFALAAQRGRQTSGARTRRRRQLARQAAYHAEHRRAGAGEWLAVWNVCPFRRCITYTRTGEYDGFSCPCFGAHFDLSGRIRKGPAPRNMQAIPISLSEDGHTLTLDLRFPPAA